MLRGPLWGPQSMDQVIMISPNEEIARSEVMENARLRL